MSGSAGSMTMRLMKRVSARPMFFQVFPASSDV
jgi:hypothetical protein